MMKSKKGNNNMYANKFEKKEKQNLTVFVFVFYFYSIL